MNRTDQLLELYHTENVQDINIMLGNFSSLTNCLMTLVQNLFDEKVEIKYYQRELEGKCFRFGVANQSLINLINGNEFILVTKKVKLVDVDSLYSLTRMQIETYLILYYLLFDEVTDGEKDFRYCIYKLHGLKKQGNLEIPSDTTYIIAMKRKIEEEILEVIENIKVSTIYQNANEKQKQEYLEPKYAKLVKSEIIFRKSGIGRITEMWKLFSNYAHAEYISDRQYNTRRSDSSTTKDQVHSIMVINRILTSKLIMHLKHSFPESERKYQTFELKEKVQVEMWVNF